MIDFWFVGVERFNQEKGEAWDNYVEWSGLTQLQELVSLDSLLCPAFLPVSEEDWKQTVRGANSSKFFGNLLYLIKRIEKYDKFSILAVVFEPQSDVRKTLDDKRFLFYGYDLIEAEMSGVSALNNCGGFDQAFDNKEISEVGLISDYDLARTVQHRLRKFYPNEVHADCDLWAIWRMDSQ